MGARSLRVGVDALEGGDSVRLVRGDGGCDDVLRQMLCEMGWDVVDVVDVLRPECLCLARWNRGKTETFMLSLSSPAHE